MWSPCRHITLDHSSQVQQGPGTDILQIPSHFDQLLVPMREAIPRNFTSIGPFFQFLWLFQVSGTVQDFCILGFVPFSKALKLRVTLI